MATLVLGSLGGALGGVLGGPVGAALGKAAGSFVGNALDQQLFGTPIEQEGPRLSSLTVQTSTEGAGLPIVYGRARLTGQMIWATNYEEVATTTSSQTGGKGGGPSVTTTTYSYYANLAIGLCEGEIKTVSRVWADGKPLDLSTVTMRVYKGTETQLTDPLIAAKDGVVPAYRGIAYVVFERLPLEDYGNRIPQLSFEVVRTVGGLEDKLRAITLIPGATEFGYDPLPVTRYEGHNTAKAENNHTGTTISDWSVALDQLQALCPNLERVALVVAWFGDTLDAASCTIAPRVELSDKRTSKAWSVAGLTRTTATPVSQNGGQAAYGSSPDDGSVMRAIADLKARGLKVTLVPFIMMDVPENNGLVDPETGSEPQPAYPWRGQITVSPAPGHSGSPDKTAAASAAIAAFSGTATAADFSVSSGKVSYQGPNEWSFRRFILHMAALAKAAGGVDAFLLCSEMRGLTTVRGNGTASYPFVDELVSLAGEARSLLGAQTLLTYGADWSEFSNHVPSDGSGDLTFHLDPLWASSDIDAIGIDLYQPLTDWRYRPGHLDEALGSHAADPRVIQAGLAGGENYDWYYASDLDRDAQLRSPITDGAYGEPWVFRSKDLVSWWSNPHHNRVGGVREAQPTAFVPESKPLWFTEFGAPATDLVSNRPSAFPSDKPGDLATRPPFSHGERDDAVQRAILETAIDAWSDLGSALNPISSVTGAPMIDPSAIHVWTWDTRPFPEFPLLGDVWSDAVNWARGHWLNGRLGAIALADVLADLCARHGLPPLDTQSVVGLIDGYVLSGPVSPRGVIGDLAELFALDIRARGYAGDVQMRASPSAMDREPGGLVVEKDVPLLALNRADDGDIARQITIGFSSLLHDFQTGVVRSTRKPGGVLETEAAVGDDVVVSHPVTLDPTVAQPLAERMLHEARTAGLQAQFALPPSMLAAEPGDIIRVTDTAGFGEASFRITRLTDGAARRVEAVRFDDALYAPPPRSLALPSRQERPVFGPPDVVVMDLPVSSSASLARHNVVAAVAAKPWPGTVHLAFAPDGSSDEAFEIVGPQAVPCILGTLANALPPGPTRVQDQASVIDVSVPSGSLESTTLAGLLAGENRAAIVGAEELEVVAFQAANLVGENRYQLTGLLRGLGGTESLASEVSAAGARFVLLNDALQRLDLSDEKLMLGGTVRAISGGSTDSDLRTDSAFAAKPRSRCPLSPVHLRAEQSGDTISFSWMRRARGVADDWVLATVPLNEETEAYEVAVLVGGTRVREVEVSSPSFSYPLADRTADGALGAFTLEVRQLGVGGMRGDPVGLDVA
ncbi:MAG: glycoside hydrolase/phage tail family protein [Devosiaceae bacterium]|nr:glycoside hydrolase/phage tail family protein [Devosiaceae bacterium MH13]